MAFRRRLSISPHAFACFGDEEKVPRSAIRDSGIAAGQVSVFRSCPLQAFDRLLEDESIEALLAHSITCRYRRPGGDREDPRPPRCESARGAGLRPRPCRAPPPRTLGGRSAPYLQRSLAVGGGRGVTASLFVFHSRGQTSLSGRAARGRGRSRSHLPRGCRG
jgi:hypothetical protein